MKNNLHAEDDYVNFLEIKRQRSTINAIATLHQPIGFGACSCGVHDCPTESLLHPEEMSHDQG